MLIKGLVDAPSMAHINSKGLKCKCLFQSPEIKEIYPSTGQANGGTEITVSGTVHNYMTVAVILNTGYSIPVNFTE